MTTRFALITFLAAGAALAPRAALAQPDPAHVRTVVRAHAADAAVARRLVTRAAGAYQGGENRHQHTERVTRTLNIGASGELDISNLSGNIVVTRGGGNEANIEVVKIGHGRSDDEARQMVGLVDIQISERARRGEVRTIYHRPEGLRGRRQISVTVNYNVTAPAATRVIAKTMSGNVTVSDIKGELSLLSTSGHVKITNAERIASAKSTSGNVEITGAKLDGPLEAATVSGSVILRNVEAPRFELGTVSGNVVMADVRCERAEAHSLSGEVTYDGTLARGGRYEFNSHSGSVRVTVVGGTGFEVEANTFSGTVRLDPPQAMKGADPRDRRRNRSINAVVGDGSAFLDVTTFSGNVVITSKR